MVAPALEPVAQRLTFASVLQAAETARAANDWEEQLEDGTVVWHRTFGGFSAVARSTPKAIVGASVAEQTRLLGELMLSKGVSGHFSGRPSALRFSCAVCSFDDGEWEWGAVLRSGEPEAEAIAARRLWVGRSRIHAEAVLKRVVAHTDWSGEWQDTVSVVTLGVTPEAIGTLLDEKDPEWGVWLAQLRPHPSLVPALLKMAAIEMRADLQLALAASKDPRVLPLFLKELASGDYKRTGYAAKALGKLAMPRAEAPLLAAMDGAGVWAEANIALALGECGGETALSELRRRRAAIEGEYTGAIDLDGCLDRAIARLEERRKR